MSGIRGSVVTAPSGVLWIEHRDIDTNELIRRFRAPDEQQPAKVRLERELEDAYADWQRWKATRIEAQARSLQAIIINALTNREDAAWTTYVAAIQSWRQS